MDKAEIEGVPIDQIRTKIATFLVKAAAQGSTPSATAVLSLLSDMEAAAAAAEHRTRMAEIEVSGDTLALATYLGQLGATRLSLAGRLGREPTDPEISAWQRGARDRMLEARALELARARTGQAPPPPWALEPPPL
jgi:hypothetical protein